MSSKVFFVTESLENLKSVHLFSLWGTYLDSLETWIYYGHRSSYECTSPITDEVINVLKDSTINTSRFKVRRNNEPDKDFVKDVVECDKIGHFAQTLIDQWIGINDKTNMEEYIIYYCLFKKELLLRALRRGADPNVYLEEQQGTLTHISMMCLAMENSEDLECFNILIKAADIYQKSNGSSLIMIAKTSTFIREKDRRILVDLLITEIIRRLQPYFYISLGLSWPAVTMINYMMIAQERFVY